MESVDSGAGRRVEGLTVVCVPDQTAGHWLSLRPDSRGEKRVPDLEEAGCQSWISRLVGHVRAGLPLKPPLGERHQSLGAVENLTTELQSI